jgi:hypothetical protein
MAKTTKKQKFKKILNMTRRHGEIVVVFEDQQHPAYLRKRKITKDGKCFVSYLNSEGKWTRYATSCFVCDVRVKSLTETIKLMSKHDYGTYQPVELIVNRKAIKL